MSTLTVVRSTVIGSALLVLAGCSAPVPAPVAIDDTAGPTVCDESVFTDNVDVDVTAEASALDDSPFPLDGLGDLDAVCTAHLVVDYSVESVTVEYDILVADGNLDDVTAAVDDVATGGGWVRDEGQRIWRAPDDPKHYVQLLAIDEGVLIGTTEAG